MNYIEALNILEIDLTKVNYNDITFDFLKKQYKKLALKKHPDKNGNTPTSNETFQKLNEAYHYLEKEMNFLNSENDIEQPYEGTCEYNNSSLYYDILRSFMKTVFEGKYNDILTNIVNDIITASKIISAKLFDDLDKDTTLNIYTFLSNNRDTLHLSQEKLNKIREIVVKKYNNVEVYKLNPSITDLLNNNIYKLFINDELFLVPLWHNETYFDGSGCEIIVLCEPDLPNNISIDNENNIHVKTEIIATNNLFNLILNNHFISVNIGDKEFIIYLSNLFMQKEQYYRIKNVGLSKIKKDIYDISEKTDIIVKINII
jgi:curved DNA-binding protein CbpA